MPVYKNFTLPYFLLLVSYCSLLHFRRTSDIYLSVLDQLLDLDFGTGVSGSDAAGDVTAETVADVAAVDSGVDLLGGVGVDDEAAQTTGAADTQGFNPFETITDGKY